MARKIELRKQTILDENFILTELYLDVPTMKGIDALSKEDLLKRINHYKRRTLPSYFDFYLKAKRDLKILLKNVYKKPFVVKEKLSTYGEALYKFELENKIYNYMRYRLENFSKEQN